jgi:predicted dehydrogenase
VTALRLAVLGHGFISDLHCQAARSAGAEVVIVAGRDHDRVAGFAANHHIERFTADWREAVSAKDVDAVVIGTPNAQHCEQALAAIAHNKHVLIDKPMATTVAEAQQIADAAGRADRTVLVGHMWRYRNEVIAARDLIMSGEVGRPVRTRGYGIHAGWGPSGWFVDPSLSGGGALIDMGIHAIDTARFLLGDPSPTKVMASIGTAYGDYDVDDDAVVIVEWSSQVRSVIEAGWWQPRLDGVEAETEVFGTGGHLQIWPAFTAHAPPPADYVHCSLPMYTTQMADFVTCCRTGATPIASVEVGITALSIVEQAYSTAGISRAIS